VKGWQHVHSQPAGNFPAKIDQVFEKCWLVGGFDSTQLKNISQNMPKWESSPNKDEN